MDPFRYRAANYLNKCKLCAVANNDLSISFKIRIEEESYFLMNLEVLSSSHIKLRHNFDTKQSLYSCFYGKSFQIRLMKNSPDNIRAKSGSIYYVSKTLKYHQTKVLG